MSINGFDMNASTNNAWWLSHEPDVVEVPQSEQGQSETGTSVVAGTAKNQGKSPKSTGVENFAQDLGNLCTADTEHQASLK